MLSDIKVSIIVITYNSQSTICETLDSVCAIAYDGPLELIIADDHSTDQTIQEIQKWLLHYGDRFCRTQIVSPAENTGTAKNLQRGYLASTGKYLRFVAGDDRITPDAIRRSVTSAEEHHTDWVIGRTKVFGNADGYPMTINQIQTFYDEAFEALRDHFSDTVQEMPIRNVFPSVSSFFFRRELIGRVGGIDEGYPLLEDYPFLYKLCRANIQPSFVDHAVTEYRISPKSISHTSGSETALRYMRNRTDFFFDVRQRDLWRQKRYAEWAKQTLVMQQQRQQCRYGENSWKSRCLKGVINCLKHMKAFLRKYQ